MAKEFHVKKRRPVRRKHIAPLLKELEEGLDIDLAVDGAFLEMASYGPWQLVFVDKVAKTIEVNDDDGRRWVFLTLRGFLEHGDAKLKEFPGADLNTVYYNSVPGGDYIYFVSEVADQLKKKMALPPNSPLIKSRH